MKSNQDIATGTLQDIGTRPHTPFSVAYVQYSFLGEKHYDVTTCSYAWVSGTTHHWKKVRIAQQNKS